MPRTARVVPWMARIPQGVRVRASDDRRYRLLTVFAPPARVSPWEALAYFAWFPVLVAVLCYVLAVYLASPLPKPARRRRAVWPRRPREPLSFDAAG